jgi:hypothetical protein
VDVVDDDLQFVVEEGDDGDEVVEERDDIDE